MSYAGGQVAAWGWVKGPGLATIDAMRLMLLTSAANPNAPGLAVASDLDAVEIATGGGYVAGQGGVPLAGTWSWVVAAYNGEANSAMDLDIGTAGLTTVDTLTATWRSLAVIAWTGDKSTSRILTIFTSTPGDDSASDETIQLQMPSSFSGTGAKALVSIITH